MYGNPIYLITGGSNGNGLAISKELLKENLRVVNLDVVQSQNPSELYKEFIGSVTDENLIEKVLRFCVKETEEIYLVNNAGITRPKKGSYPLILWRETLEVNLTAPFMFLEAYCAHVEAKRIKKGAIVNLGSLSSHRAFPDNPAYVASKHGIIGLTKYYARKLGKFGVRVNSVSPGYIKTSMTKESQSNKKKSKLITDSSFLGRWGDPRDVALAVKFLLSGDSQFVTGTDFVVDGGWLSQGFRD